MGSAGPEHPEWSGRLADAQDSLIPWIGEAISLAGRTVLEYGCGQGAVACAFAPLVGRHIGIDIEEGEVALAREHVRRRELANVELVVEPVGTILDRVATYRGEVDVFLLYAVLEHMTPDERLAILRLARDVVRPDGHIVVAESPNRLTPIDHHTGRMPFLHALPPELTAEYHRRSTREEFVAAIAAADDATDALVRWGTGVSFHEFELVFEDLAAHTVASSFHPLLYPIRPARLEELHLAATLEAWRPDLAPCWSRTWLDVILAARPLADPPEHVRPWPLRLAHDVRGAAVLADGRIELRPGARLAVTLPAPTDEVHVGLMAEHPEDALRVHLPAQTVEPVAAPNRVGVPPWHAALRLPEAHAELELSLPEGGCVTYVGYRGAPDPAASLRRPQGW